MKLLELFRKQMFYFPQSGGPNFPELIKQKLAEYISLLTKVDDKYHISINDAIGDIQKSCDSINEIISLMYSGNLIQSYRVLDCILEKMEPLLSEDRFPAYDVYLYRARIDEGNITSPSDMFHRPFEQRFDIQPTRYSISGLPCLYLSNSVFTCWSELDKPIIDKMMISKFRPSTSLKFLNLLPSYDWYREVLSAIELGEYSDEWRRAMQFTTDIWLTRTLKIFPILLVCYSQVYQKSAMFKPEYLFPQLLMQWLLLRPDYHGIKYLSNKSLRSGDWRNEFINYALPVKDISIQGFCSNLASLFEVTTPLSLEIIKLTNPMLISAVRNVNEKPFDSTSNVKSYRIVNTDYDYNNSVFKLLEKNIADLPFGRIITN